MRNIMSHMAGVTVKLQGQDMDVIEAYKEITQLKEVYAVMRKTAEDTFKDIFQDCERWIWFLTFLIKITLYFDKILNELKKTK